MKRFFALFFYLSVASAASLPDAVTQIMKANKIPQSALSVYLVPVDGTTPVWAVNEKVQRNPASTMKLVTSYAGFALLGPDYRWKTVLGTTGRVDAEGTLQGDLYLKGYGDPKLTIEQIDLLMQQLRARGIKRLGNIVIDQSWFRYIKPTQAFDDTPLQAYNVLPEALIFNFNAFKVMANSDTKQTTITVEPNLIPVNNGLKLGKNACAGEMPEPVTNGVIASIKGSFPRNCAVTEYYQLMPADNYIGQYFITQWIALGGEFISGSGVSTGVMPPEAEVFVSFPSASLTEMVSDINKYSNNLMARMLFLTLGAELASTEKNTLLGARAVMQRWLMDNSLSNINVDNGAGLSRTASVTVESLAKLVQSAMHSHYADAFEASMPVVGVDGSMKNRLKNHPIAGQAHIKTGTLNGVIALAGVIDTPRKYVFVAIVNTKQRRINTQVLDEVLKYAWDLAQQDNAK